MGDWTYLGMPTDVASYRRLLTTIVEAFDGDGFRDAPGLKKGIKYWQVENEWDWRWKDTPESFVAFLKIAYETIKAADPDAKVVLGGISKLAPDAFHAGLLGDSFELNGKIITPASLEQLQSFRKSTRYGRTCWNEDTRTSTSSRFISTDATEQSRRRFNTFAASCARTTMTGRSG
jgi:hypothetical protein